MRKIAATYLFTGKGKPIKYGILLCKDDGEVQGILNKGDNFKEEAGLEYYTGILMPGLICSIKNIHSLSIGFRRKLWTSGIALGYDDGLKKGIRFENGPVVSLTDALTTNPDKANDLNTTVWLKNLIASENSIPELMIELQNQGMLLHELLQMVTYEAAKCIRLESRFGSFEKGKVPGINLLTGIDFKSMTLRPEARIKRLL